MGNITFSITRIRTILRDCACGERMVIEVKNLLIIKGSSLLARIVAKILLKLLILLIITKYEHKHIK